MPRARVAGTFWLVKLRLPPLLPVRERLKADALVAVGRRDRDRAMGPLTLDVRRWVRPMERRDGGRRLRLCKLRRLRLLRRLIRLPRLLILERLPRKAPPLALLLVRSYRLHQTRQMYRKTRSEMRHAASTHQIHELSTSQGAGGSALQLSTV